VPKGGKGRLHEDLLGQIGRLESKNRKIKEKHDRQELRVEAMLEKLSQTDRLQSSFEELKAKFMVIDCLFVFACVVWVFVFMCFCAFKEEKV